MFSSLLLLCLFSFIYMLNVKTDELSEVLSRPVISTETVTSVNKETAAEETVNDVEAKDVDNDTFVFEPDRQVTYSEDDAAAIDILYIVAEHDGKIGIFERNQTTLLDVIDVNVSYLPDMDKEYLKNGIPVYSYNQLQSVISDYTD
jgi:hypothetical protein